MKTILSCVAFTLVSLVTQAADFNRYAFTLETREGNTISHIGTGCLVKHGPATYYITARHIFEGIDDESLAASLKALAIVNKADTKIRAKPETVVPVPYDEKAKKTDFLVLKTKSLPQLAKYTLKLATSAPQKDEVVFLAAQLPDRALATYPLKVLELTDDLTKYEKLPGVEKYTGVSGGPIINSEGALVGTYLGRGHDNKQTILYLYGTPFSALKSILESEVADSGSTSSGPVAKEVAAARLWKSSTGQFSVTATLVSFDGKVVQLKTAEGRTINVPLEKLSAEDQEFLRGQAEKK
jgi:SLA1 homology domain 1, SHD1